MKFTIADAKYSTKRKQTSGSLLINGQPVGTFEVDNEVNEETGLVATKITIPNDIIRVAVDQHIATIPPIDRTKYNLPPYFQSLRYIVIDLVNDWATLRYDQKQCKRRTLFKLKDATDQNQWMQIEGPYTPAAHAFLVKTYGDNLGEILNARFGPPTDPTPVVAVAKPTDVPSEVAPAPVEAPATTEASKELALAA